MDYLLLKLLIAQVNTDLKDFLHVNIFALNAFGEGETSLNGRPLSKTEERHFYVSSLARSILDNPPIDRFLTSRQYAAAELLYSWGRILRPPELQPNHNNLLRTSIKNYIGHLETNEAKLFNSLLDNEPEKDKQHAENLDKQYDNSRLWELADQVAEKIRNDDGAVSLNKVSHEMTKNSIRDKNKDLLHGQKGWHNESWIKTRIKGWKDPILRK